MSFKPYPKYKESGVEWLGRVPEHWEVCRSDAVLGTCRTTIGPESLAGKPVFHYSIPVIQLTGDGQHEDGSEIDSGKLVVTEPQVLVSKLNPRKGTVCIALPQGVLTVCSSEFVPLLPRRADIRFVWYLVQTENYRTRLESLVESATKSHQRASPSDIYRVTWAFPTKEEQGGIATFLDHETAKIDALIAEQQRLIELLQEKRQAVISHAVTKGLNPNAPMKDSGIEWLGEVPEHWEVRRISSLSTKITNGYVGPTRDILVDSGVRYLQSLHIKNNSIAFNDAYFVKKEWSDAHAKSILQEGDVLIVQTGDIGQAAVVPKEFEGCNCHALIIVAPVREVLTGDWLGWVLNSDYGFHSLLSIQTGALHPHLNCGDVKDLSVPIPPLNEQREVSEAIVDRIGSITSLLDEATIAIALLQERRSALISAAVTGQIDVRGFSAGGGSEAP